MTQDGRVVLVTGAARGIGRAVATRLAGEGWRVVAVDRQAPAAGLPGRFVQTDVAAEAEVAALLAGVRAREGRLDALVSNAGIMLRKPLADLSLAAWSQVLATNLTATFLLVRAAEALLREARGAVVTIASTRARQSEADTESYAASKGGLVALSHALAVSLGPAVRVNAVSPGWIDTGEETLRAEDHAQHPAGRVGRPADVAALVAWLVGPESGFVTGAEFTTDGGMTRKMIYAG
ncbi:SDR family oxidoreductase [Falsiroseomonas selenitidurans]|uniref:SDR family oxidoreductase n=1 Tax=Falsiroseomonas selenitidurans TaxID=2716335 RepID=A0ABX1E7M7_9PROT|nr:SDR family oxidoreductase [Falsiroseomonas selenitidurans]NKC33214.1 SDR family oxidoreductase [Falsiroseomonas selenitidurans]